jgi:hypothetical protein
MYRNIDYHFIAHEQTMLITRGTTSLRIGGFVEKGAISIFLQKNRSVIPAEAGIQKTNLRQNVKFWILASP